MKTATVRFDEHGKMHGPADLKVKHAEKIRWDVVNESEANVSVWFENFHETCHTGGSPLKSNPRQANAPAKAHGQPGKDYSDAVVQDKGPDGKVGVHTYKYTVAYQFHGQKRVEIDPEVIIEWPT